MIVDEKSVKHFGDLGATDYFKGKDFLIDKLIDHEFQGDLNPDLLNSKIEENIDGIEKLLDQTLKVELTLTNPKLKTIDSVKRSVGRFMEKYRIALVRNESVLHGRINRLLSQTYPGNKLQERVISVYSFELLYGENVLSEIRSQFEEWFKNNVS